MAKTFPLLCLLALLCLSSSSISANAAEADFLYLTLAWPGSYCRSGGRSKSCCAPLTGEPAVDFLVEGVETYDSATGKPVTACANPCRFFVNQLSKFIEDMFTYWPDLSCPSNNGVELWRSEWCNYGTCSNLTQADYFNRTLTLRSKINIMSVLSDNGIVPSDKDTYKLEDIEAALISKFGFSTVVECQTKKSRLSTEYLLSKVRFCVSIDAKKLIGCPISKNSTCGEDVKFYPFDNSIIGDNSASSGIHLDLIEMPLAKDMAN